MRATLHLPFGLAALVVLQVTSGSISAQPVRPASVPHSPPVTGAGNSYTPVFSVDGRYVAFLSHANNLVTNDDLGPHLDLFLRDLATTNSVLVSVNTNGIGGGNDDVGCAVLSSNGQFVAFETAASNLVPDDSNRAADIFVRDTVAGTTTLVSVNADGSASGIGPSWGPLISADGRYVIFESGASNLVTNDFNGTNDIFIRDLTRGVTRLVSLNADATASANGPSGSPSISTDGLIVAFASQANDIVVGATNRLGEIYVRDVVAGSNYWAVASHLSSTHDESTGAYSAWQPVLSADGRFVAFKTPRRVVRFDWQRPTNAVHMIIGGFGFDDNPRLSVAASDAPLSFSPDGRYLVYTTTNTVVPNPGVLRVDFESLLTNVTLQYCCEGSRDGQYYFITNVVPTADPVIRNFNPTVGGVSWTAINADASRVFFLSDLTNLVPVAAHGTWQLYVRDLPDGSVQILSTNRSATPGPDLNGVVPATTPDGSRVAWDSPDPDVLAGDDNQAWDIFVRDLDTGETRAASTPHPSRPAATGTMLTRLAPGALSANGRWLTFTSLDPLLGGGADSNLTYDAFLFDSIAGTNLWLSGSFPARTFWGAISDNTPTNAVSSPLINADGRYAIFLGQGPGNTWSNLFRRDLRGPSSEFVPVQTIFGPPRYGPPRPQAPALSSDGLLLAYQVEEMFAGSGSPPVQDNNATFDIIVRDYRASSNGPSEWPIAFDTVVSVNVEGIATANGPSVYPVFSPDTRWLAFQSEATDLVPEGGTAGAFQLFVRDLAANRTRLVSYLTVASAAPDGRSTDLPLPGGVKSLPVFSADSRSVAFATASDTIYRHDLLADFIFTVTPQIESNLTLFVTNYARATNTLVCVGCANPSLSADGRFIAFETRRENNAINDVLVKDLLTGETELISVNSAGTGGGNGPSFTPLISYDARYVVFASKASDLFPNDTNRATDIFVRDRLNRVTHCVSRNFAGTGTGNRVSSNPVLAADGRTMAFQSFASDLVPGDYNDTRDVFVLTLGGPDTDGDGMDDDWEMAYFSTLSRDGTGDFDGDGLSDLQEFRAGTNPADGSSILRVLTLSTAAGQPMTGRRTTVLLWSAVPGRTYRVQFKENVDAEWIELAGDVVAGSATASQTHVTAAEAERGFYRVLLAE